MNSTHIFNIDKTRIDAFGLDYFYNDVRFEYTGEVDMIGQACGFGEAVHTGSHVGNIKLRGTFLDNKIHGLGKCINFQ